MNHGLLIIGFFIFLLTFLVPPTVQFILLGIGIIILSLYSGDITEELAKHYSSTIGGLINATLGNIGELIIGLFALKQGLNDVVQASITGSIVGNLLFLFGLAIMINGLFFKKSTIKKKVSEINSTLLMITVILLFLPSLLPVLHESSHYKIITLWVAGIMFFIYISSLIFSLITHKKWFLDNIKEKPQISKLEGWIFIIISVFLMTVMSDMFSKLIEAVSLQFGFNELFMGAIIVGMIGNIGEHISSLKFSLKNKMDLVVSISIGSALQVGLFVLPVLVFASFLMGNPLILNFKPVESVSMFVSALLLNEVTKDSEVNWFEGLELIALYILIAVLFYFAV